MRNKLIYSLLTLFALFLAGSGITMLYLYKTTSDLEAVINLHRVEIIRQDLVINAQTVQTNLYTMGTAFGKELDVIVENVLVLDESVRKCLSCHHTKEITARLEELVVIVDQYQDALSYLITTTANPDRVERLRMVAIDTGNALLAKTQEMAFISGQKLGSRTFSAIKEINNSRAILIVTLILSFFIALAIAITMTRQITEPIYELMNATRRIKSGEFGYTTDYRVTGEFKELIDSFNDMSRSLDESNKKVMSHLHSLSNLYSVTLSFHSIANKSDIYREVARGVAELVGAEQCGLILSDGDAFVHTSPAVGLGDDALAFMRFSKEDVMRLYSPSKKRAFILNENIDDSPTSGIDRRLNVRNLMLVWVKHKGEIIGAIRVANKKSGVFSEEDVRPLAILANNLSVALENAKLYEDLKKQMEELKEAQEQLLQAAKLAAIGELASNVAHEINNPLTSILGYAELLKEEDDPDNIRRDLDIIEKESLRAREIVYQLLEFARKRSLEIKDVDVHGMINDVIGLVSLQVKDTKIRISKNFGEIPHIEGDPNQLKQVFLNIINNAIFAMDGEGSLGISTYTADGNVCVAVSDTGRGIPPEIMPRIFEPFFSTKREKGTGIGLSVSYKIIQGHNGRIDVESKPGRGSTFTVVLPVAGAASRVRTEASGTSRL